MRVVTALVALVVAGGLLAVAGYGLVGADGATLSASWVSDTGRQISSNHHAVAVADGSVYAPISGADGSDRCALVAIDAESGATTWRYGIPPANCTIHSVADPAVADVTGDGAPEVVAATTEKEVTGFDPEDGEVTFRHGLSDYGYTKPVVADIAPAPGEELVVADVTGTVFVVGADGTERWTYAFDEYVWSQPVVADFDSDGEPELLVAGKSGTAVLFSGNGSVEWRSAVADGDAVTWATTGQADDDAALEAVFSTVDGDAVAVDGSDGDVEWRRNVGEFAAVNAFSAGGPDAAATVYVTSKDGRVRALDAETGAVRWTTEVVTERVQMMPPPSLGDVDGDGAAELVAPGNDGSVTVLDPATGDVVATYARDAPIFAPATLSDADGDGTSEAYVIYADGRVVRLKYEAS
ncbi:PQQ-binding-like beta-propeller repeat protein [Halopelagius fulvigenes]|uniref:PQQ-binding-like beta-propeller repeat protein n=1 Tax=Halopelagius fulvigenes TaxID=1198324 RepID=A0ABD5U148_9EURY